MLAKKIIPILIVTLFLLVNMPAKSSEAATTGWTVMVWMNGDNTLNPFVDDDLNEIRSASLNPDVQVYCVLDYSSKASSVKKFTESGEQSYSMAEFGLPVEPNMANYNTVLNFINNIYDRTDSDNYAFIFWNHGWSFLAATQDDTSKDRMTIDELQRLQALPNNLDVVGFDECYMGSYSVTFAVSRFADYMIASPNTEPGPGWDYTFLEDVQGTTSPVEFGRYVVDTYKSFYPISSDNTLACYDLVEFTYFVFNFDQTMNYLQYEDVNKIDEAIRGTRKYTTNPNAIIDIDDFFEKLMSKSFTPLTKSSIQSSWFVFNSSVLRGTNSYAMSIYLPPLKYAVDERIYSAKVTLDTYYGIFLQNIHNGGLTGVLTLPPVPTMTKTETILRLDAPPDTIGQGWRVEAKINNGDWMYGTIAVDQGETLLIAARFYDGSTYSAVNLFEYSGISVVTTEVQLLSYLVPINEGWTFFTPLGEVGLTADEFLEITGAQMITRIVDGVAQDYLKSLKNVDDNFILERGVGYIVYSDSTSQYVYDGYESSIASSLTKGMNILGATRDGSASDLAQTIFGDTIISIYSDGLLKNYISALDTGDFEFDEGDSLFVFVNYDQKVTL